MSRMVIFFQNIVISSWTFLKRLILIWNIPNDPLQFSSKTIPIQMLKLIDDVLLVNPDVMEHTGFCIAIVVLNQIPIPSHFTRLVPFYLALFYPIVFHQNYGVLYFFLIVPFIFMAHTFVLLWIFFSLSEAKYSASNAIQVQ